MSVLKRRAEKWPLRRRGGSAELSQPTLGWEIAFILSLRTTRAGIGGGSDRWMNLRRHNRDRFGARVVSAFCPPAPRFTPVELHCSRNAGHPKLLPWPSNTAPTRENSGDRKPG